MTDRKACSDGVLVVDKPVGPTSHDIVMVARRAIQTKVGHTGTLDPMASGVLPLVLGRATRLSRYLLISDKEYLAEIELGKETDTYDSEGTLIHSRQVSSISARDAEELLDTYRGEIVQVPPMYSAVRIDGERLYKAARRSEKKERSGRLVTVYRLELLSQTELIWKLRVTCSSGTYIRSLAHDIGQDLGCGAIVKSLRRIRSGPFTLKESVRADQIAEEWSRGLVPLNSLLPELPKIELDAAGARRISHGNPIHLGRASLQSERCRVVSGQNLIAIGCLEDGVLRPKLVLRTQL